MTRLRYAVAAAAGAAGLAGSALEDFVLAVHELVTNVVRHGGGSGRVRLLRDVGSLSCQVIDHGPGADYVPIALPRPGTPGHRGLWLAQQLERARRISRDPDLDRADIGEHRLGPAAVAGVATAPIGRVVA